MAGESAGKRTVGGEVDHVGEHEEAVDEVEVGGGASCRTLGIVSGSVEKREVGDSGLLSGRKDVVGVGNVFVHGGVGKEGRGPVVESVGRDGRGVVEESVNKGGKIDKDEGLREGISRMVRDLLVAMVMAICRDSGMGSERNLSLSA